MASMNLFLVPVPSIVLLWLTIALLFIPPSSPSPDGLFKTSGFLICRGYSETDHTKVDWEFIFELDRDDPCSQNWDGVQCQDGSIIALNLSNKGLLGSVPSEMANLKSLVNLDLSNSKNSNGSWNHVNGDLSAISKLTNLKSLNLSFNYINAEFPTSVLGLTALTDLRIDNAGLTGTFPSDWSKLTNLEYLYLGNNSMTGTLPSDIGSLTSMIEMSLWGNTFFSEIPDITRLTNLKYLNLHDCSLYGGLPDSFQNMKNLQRLHLYNNLLTGPVPESWQKISSLQELRLNNNSLTKNLSSWLLTSTSLNHIDLSYNQFYGPVSNISNDKLNFLNIACNFFTGIQPTNISHTNLTDFPNCFDPDSSSDNRYTCRTSYTCDEFKKDVGVANGCPNCPYLPNPQQLTNSTSCVCSIVNSEPATSHSGTIIGIVIGAVAVCILGVVGFLVLRGHGCFQKHNSSKTSVSNINNKFFNKGSQEYWEAPKGVERFSLADLEAATSGFSIDHEIGVGGFGKVFHGILANGKEVAIKRASGMPGGTEFRNEVMLLSRLHHRNLVRLEGFCEDNDVQILVYEYVPNGDLHRHLFQNTTSFGWLRRLDIAVGIAQGLDYLHSFADPPVIHRDVKPSNVLLDNNMVAKVADFGISRSTLEFETHISTTPAGTAGYIDPQYFLRRQLTTASDVYSFGVLLLELVTGQKAIDVNRVEDHNLVEWAKMKIKVDGLNGIIDPRIADDCPVPIYQDVANLALRCADFNKDGRPHMNEALTILDSCLRVACPHPMRALSLELSTDHHSTIQILEEEAMDSKRRDTKEEDKTGEDQPSTTFNSVLSANKSTFKSKFMIPR